jgi:hypothetical protein
MKNDDIAQRFARDTGPHTHEELLPYKHIGPCRLITTRPHEITVLHDDGPYRHLRFKSPDQSAYWFDIITWPGCLTVRGDLNSSYTFAATTDMFGFFRGNSHNGSINPDYWTQKLTTPGGRDAITNYDPELFEQQVKGHVVTAIRGGDTPRGLGRAITRMLTEGDIGWEDGARAELERFEHGAKVRLSCLCRATAEFDADEYVSGSLWRGDHRSIGHMTDETRVEGWRFHDVWEWSFRDYDWSFLWACQAIVWGIAQYNVAKASTESVLVAGGVL